jgi:hypothetical protein
MTQSQSVYEDLTVRQNLDYFRKVLRLDVDEIQRKIGAVDPAQQSETLRWPPDSDPTRVCGSCSPTLTLATAQRILAQIRCDPRTVELLLGLFPFTIMFLITSITTLREWPTGTLERLMSVPLKKGTSSAAIRWRSGCWGSCSP